MLGRYHDGRTTAVTAAEAELSSDRLVIRVGDEAHAWPLDRLNIERIGPSVRIGRPPDPARLTLDAAAWRAATHGHIGFVRHTRRREWTLVLGLTAAAAGVALFIFVGVPLASGPLARATPPAFEAAMGRNFQAQLQVAFPSCTGEGGQAALARLGARLGQASGAAFPIRVTAVEAPMANAFALPGGAVLVTDDLIDMAATPDELAAVLAHETAHVQRRHVMQAVWRSLGLGIILDAVVGGGTGAGQQAVLLMGSFADLRYSRDAEQQADADGQAILHRLGLSSQGMASFFQRLAAREGSREAAMVKELVSSHPDSARRARLSRARAHPGVAALTPVEWRAVRQACAAEWKQRRIPFLGAKPAGP